jgi:large subunit ribosomal protein L15
MFKLHSLKVTRGARSKRKVVGRGLGTGHGTYSGRGAKGQKARKSGGTRPGFEGGRQPITRQTPKLRGFKSRQAKAFPLKVSKLNIFNDGDIVTVEALKAKKLVPEDMTVKILAGGDLKKKLTVKAPVSTGAKTAIEKAGGQA